MDLNTDLVFQYLKSLIFYNDEDPESCSSSGITKEQVVGWRLSLAFFGTASFLNGIAVLLILYIWIINRQTHVKKTKGSHVGFKPHDETKGSRDESESDDEDDESTGGGVNELELDKDNDDAGGDHEISPGKKSIEGIRRSQKWRRLMSDVKRSKAWESIMNFEVDQDDDVDDAELELERARQSRDRRREFGAAKAVPSDRPTYGSLAEIASKIKVFSYLGQDALKLCLSEAEYVDLEPGQELFERGSFDGSLFVVLAGGIRCLFHEYPFAEEDIDADMAADEKVLSFTSGPGTVVTPLLAMLESLVQHQRIQTNADDADAAVSPRPLSMADGVSAVATKNSRLIKVPAKCYSVVMDSFPEDVHRVATTIVQRVQRVTLQTLVKTLGLHTELLRRGADFETPNAWANRMASKEWYRLSSSLTVGGTKPFDMSATIRDAAVVVAEELEMPKECISTLQKNATLVTLKKGETLIKTGVPHHALYFVLTGEMDVGPEIPGDTSSSFHRFTKVGPGAIIGRLACFSGDVSIFSARALSNEVKLLRLPKAVFDELIIANPRAMVSCFEHILILLSPSVHLVNWASQWQFVQASEVIARKGDACDSMFMILNGRLRASYHTHQGNSLEEFGRGRCIGDIAGISKKAWPCKVYAIRNSEIATVPIKVLEALIRTHPSAGLHFSRVIASQVSRYGGQAGQATLGGTGERKIRLQRGSRASSSAPSSSLMPSYGLSLATIAVVPMSSDIDASAFCSAMVASLERVAPTKLLTKSIARHYLGEKVYNHQNAVHELKMIRFLGEVEERNRLVVFQTDESYTWWTRTCIGQADAILLLVKADDAPASGKIERCLEWAYDSMQVRIEVVIVDESNTSTSEEDGSVADLTNPEIDVSDALDNWSEQRPWIAGHHLVRAPFSVYEKDILRLCRRMTGLSVGLVLGGGGARGLAHLGVIKALLEAGITVDMVGGTSQGAFIGALFARSPDNFDLLMERSRQMAARMASPLEKILDLTLPLCSMFSGYRFNLQIMESLGKTTRIQDLVLKFFCVSTDVQRCELMVHTKGICWKYVRASMSLTGYLPPISENGSLLVDGGYMSVIPTDVMKEQAGARTVISVDVSGEDQKDYYEYGTYLSGWWLLFNSLNPFSTTVNVPSMGDISDALRWVSSDQHRRRMETVADLHLRPPIQGYGTLEYDKFDEIVQKGYDYARPLVAEFIQNNPSLVSGQTSPRKAKQ